MEALAVVIPVLNCLKYTQEAVASLPAHRHLILIDNGSTDGTREWALSGEVDKPLTYMRRDHNMGVAKSWNLGIRTAFDLGFDPVLVMNNDVVLATDTIPALLKWHEKTRGFVTAVTVAARNALYVLRREEDMQLPPDFSCFLISKEIVERVGWFDEEYYPAYFEDADYDVRLEIAGVTRGCCRDAVAVHFGSRTIHEGGLDHREGFERNRKRYTKKWKDFLLARGRRQ